VRKVFGEGRISSAFMGLGFFLLSVLCGGFGGVLLSQGRPMGWFVLAFCPLCLASCVGAVRQRLLVDDRGLSVRNILGGMHLRPPWGRSTYSRWP
jgi:hypothetical protein